MLADYVARFRGRGELGKASHLSRLALKWLAIATLPAVALILLFAQPLANYLQLSSITPILVLSTAFLPTLLIPAVSGIIQGLEQFRLLALVLFLGAVVRIGFGVSLVWLGWGAAGGMAGFTAAGLVSVGVGLFAVRHLLRQPGQAHEL